MSPARIQTTEPSADPAPAPVRTRSRRVQKAQPPAPPAEPKTTEEKPAATVSDLMNRPHLLPGWVDPVTFEDLVAARRDIHRTPEPGWSEFIATARLAEAFRSAGYSVP